MNTLVIATNNAGKLREIQQLFNGHYDEILTMKQAGVELNTVEDGETFIDNAVLKAMEANRLTGLDALADDSGLTVDALGGAPGVYSARFAGQHGDDKANVDKLLSMLEGVEVQNRTAAFVCAIALCRCDGSVITTEGRCDGRIAFAPEGEEGFGYDPVFFYEPFQKTFGCVTSEQKNSVSHRANALRSLSCKLKAEA